MEQGYWLHRKRQELAMARNASGARARLIHFDLAGRYSVKAASAGGIAQLSTEHGSVSETQSANWR